MNPKGSGTVEETGKASADSRRSVCTSKHISDEPTVFSKGRKEGMEKTSLGYPWAGGEH